MRKYYIIGRVSHHHENENGENTVSENQPSYKANDQEGEYKDNDNQESKEGDCNAHEKEIRERVTTKFWDDPGYRSYVNCHGLHFTSQLALWASRKMVNADKSSHSWTISSLASSMKSANMGVPNGMNMGDALYLANMYYSDLAPDFNEEQVMKIVNKILHDPDGYEGMPFVRFTADVMSKNMEVPWKELM